MEGRRFALLPGTLYLLINISTFFNVLSDSQECHSSCSSMNVTFPDSTGKWDCVDLAFFALSLLNNWWQDFIFLRTRNLWVLRSLRKLPTSVSVWIGFHYFVSCLTIFFVFSCLILISLCSVKFPALLW